MGQPRVLQIGPLSDRFNHALAAAYAVTPLWRQAEPRRFLEARGADFELVVTSAGHGCSAAMIDCLPALRAICSFGVGYDAIDVAAAHGRGIRVSNTPEVLNDCVADLAIGLIIDSARRMSHSDRFVRAGSWANGSFGLGRRVSGKRLGIVGLGRIGHAVAKRSSGFDMPVRYHNRSPLAGCAYGYEANLIELARWADFLVLSCVGGAQTHHLVGREVLEALGPQGILINVARGSVVDQAALLQALGSGALGGAGLDVYAAEPQVPAALRALDNVVLLPHIGSATEETRLAMEELLLDNLRAFVSRGEMLTAV